MASMNRVFLCGHLGQAPEMRKSADGRPFARLRLATNRPGPLRPDGQREEVPDWHSVFVWGEQAESCAHLLRKGAMVFVEGALNYWESTGKQGEREFKNAVHAHRVKFITYGSRERPEEAASVDKSPGARNHNAVAHPTR